MRAFIYCRISKDHDGTALGVQRQEEDCRELAEQLGWSVVEVYVDNDVSASSGKPRPSYARMLRSLTAGAADALIAWHPDRLYRRLLDLEELITVCEGHKIALRTVKAGEMDLATPTGRMVARILGATARQEVEHKSDRWIRARAQRRKDGTPPLSRARMFGYDESGTQIIEDEAAVARMLANQVLAGRPIATLCRDLSELGVTTTLGNWWSPGGLRQYLRNPRLAGLIRWQGEIVADGRFPPILPRSTWDAVVALLASRSVRTSVRVSLLNGIVLCGLCGARLHTGSRNEGSRTYRCPIVAPYTGCGRIVATALPVEEIVESYTKERLSHQHVREAIGARSATSDVAALAASIDVDRTRLTQLEEALATAPQSVASILGAMEQVRARIDAARDRISEIQPAYIDLDGAIREWPRELDRRRALVDLVVNRVEIHPATMRGARFDVERVRIVPR